MSRICAMHTLPAIAPSLRSVSLAVSLLSFEGRIGRAAYAALSLPVFFSQHLVVWAAFVLWATPIGIGWRFLAVPLRTLAWLNDTYPILLLIGLALGFTGGVSYTVIQFRTYLQK